MHVFKAIANAKREGDLATPLIIAASSTNLEMMEMLLKYKARVHATDNDGNFAIHHSAANGHLEGVKLLMSKRCLPSVGNRRYKTPLMYATMNGHYKVVEYLVKHGVSMQYQVNKYGVSELTSACAKVVL